MSQQQQQDAMPAKGTPEYNQRMVELFEKQGGQFDPNTQRFVLPSQPGDRPEWLPEKFFDKDKGPNYEALAKSYAELEKGRGKAPPAGPAKGGDPAESAVASAGLDWDTLGQKVATTGTIEDADYQALEKAGIPKHVVDGYIANTKVAQAAARERSAKHVGGEDVLKHIMERAGKELSKEEVAAFNAQLANEKTWSAALDVLKAKFAPADGEPLGQLGGGNGSGTPVGFQSAFEQSEAINKRDAQGRKLYDVDQAYRAQVRARIAVSAF